MTLPPTARAARDEPSTPKESTMTTLQTFRLPDAVTATETDVRLGHDLVRAWRADGIAQVATDLAQDRVTADAIEASKRFFAQPMEVKARHVSDLSFSGYIASGEEVTAGEADYSEIFTVCKDLPPADPRVQQLWPCHGPVPWPSAEYAPRMQAFTDQLGSIGEKLLRLVALGLDLDDIGTFTRLTHDGWHQCACCGSLLCPRRPRAESARTPTTACWSSPRRTTSEGCSSDHPSKANDATATGWSRKARLACTKTNNRGPT
jgi:isopenicillin N synthase-like dioxygenase